MGKKRKKASGGDIPEWVVTYGDLMSLLLCFFILLAAFSELKQEREFRKVLEKIQEALGFQGGMGMTRTRDTTENSMLSFQPEQAKRDGQKRNTDENTQSSVRGRKPKTSVVTEGKRITVGGSIPFQPGSYQLSQAAKDMLRQEVTPRIKDQQFIVQIVGHAWGSGEEQSGMGLDELAFHRAQAVKDFLVRESGVDPLILRVESAGASEPVSLQVGSGDAATSNRRVQVYLTGRTVGQAHPDPNFTGGE